MEATEGAVNAPDPQPDSTAPASAPSEGEAKSRTKKEIEQWRKRIAASQKLKEDWERENRVEACYQYWKGNQLEALDGDTDSRGDRRAMVNRIHPAVSGQIPSLYYYRPFARIAATSEKADTPGTSVDANAQLIQDTANFLIRDRGTNFRESTFLALKESFWAVGVVEVGYSANFDDTGKDKPPLKENKNIKVDGESGYAEAGSPTPLFEPGKDETGLDVAADSGYDALKAEELRLREGFKGESFYVKHIPAKQFLVSISNKPILEHNDWVGYWEDVSIEDLRRNPAYNTKGLKATSSDSSDTDKQEKRYDEECGSPERIRTYKIWDLRAKTRCVMAKGFDEYLLIEPFQRCRLKVLRFDVDPYQYLPRPPILDWLGPQDEYNHSRETLRLCREAIRPRYTYSDAMDEEQIRKFESGDFGTMIPRPSNGDPDPVRPVQQPTFSEAALRTLTLAEKELADTGGVGGDPRLPGTRTATQAKIAESKDMVQDSFQRSIVAEWLSDIAQELVQLAIDFMSIDKWIAINVAPDSMYATQDAIAVAQQYQQISGAKLAEASNGIDWALTIDVESLSPITEEQKLQRWLQSINLLTNPLFAQLASVEPLILNHTLNLAGIKSSREQQLIQSAMQKVVQMQMQMAAMGQASAKGMSPMAGGGAPAQPAPTPQNSAPREGGGPQPGGPTGPGAAQPAS